MNVLVLEDDEELASFIISGLGEAGHKVHRSSDGHDAYAVLMGTALDVAVIDRMVPGLDGLSVVRRARKEGCQTPVLLLTALGGIEDRVEGLQAGADDYLVKPFAFSEFEARLDALARRPPITASVDVLEVGDIRMDLRRRQVWRAGGLVDLQPREFSLLEQLMRSADRVLSRTMLLDRVWNFGFDPQTNIVETHMSRLRSKLNERGNYNAIRTVRGQVTSWPMQRSKVGLLLHRIWALPRTFRGLTVLFAIAAALVTAILGDTTLRLVHHELERRLDAQIQLEIRNLLDIEKQGGSQALVMAVRARRTDGISYVAAHAGAMRPIMAYIVTDADGRRVAGDLNAAIPKAGYTEFIHFFRTDGSQGIAQGVNVATGSGGRLVVAADRIVIYRIDARIEHLFVMAFCAILLIGALSTYALIHVFRGRVQAFERLAVAVTAGRIEERMPLDGSGVEFDRLSAIVNEMLDRIAALLTNLREVSTALAHDLRTPLSRIRSHIERMDRAETDPVKKEGLASVLIEMDTMLELFAGMLALSELDGQAVRNRFEPVDLAKAVSDIAEAHRPAVEDSGRALDIEVSSAQVLGDRALLQRMVGNLLDNAMVHTPDRTIIEAAVCCENGQAVIRVTDNGPGVPQEHHARIFDRLVRLDRSRSSPGHGLGLSMVAAIATAHGGVAAVRPTRGGFTIEVRLPLYP
ncbi:ATP-binding protein [Novosphingobium sp. 9]|uniref:ATP-binding protein n=1 Tax=Novosphingobium sp. 9 TaxID=2025349 RepID=UPI0028CBA728|nr:ATP-binding protein [Novosphingobium sp. 9]